MKIGKTGPLMLAAIVAGTGVFLLSDGAEAHARRKAKVPAQTSRNATTSESEDNRMSDGDFFLSCKGFVPDFGGETSCGPAVDLGDE